MTLALRVHRWMAQLNVEAKFDRLKRKSEAQAKETPKESPRPSPKYPTGFQCNPQIKVWPPEPEKVALDVEPHGATAVRRPKHRRRRGRK